MACCKIRPDIAPKEAGRLSAPFMWQPRGRLAVGRKDVVVDLSEHLPYSERILCGSVTQVVGPKSGPSPC